MISHKRWPLLHYLGFKRQLGEFLGQLPQLKASMNSPPLRTQITVGHKVTKEGHEDDFLKSGTAAKVRQVAAADCRARGWWRGVYLIFVVSWLVSWISASWELSRLHHSASRSWSPRSLIPSPSHQQQNPRHWHWSGASLPLCPDSGCRWQDGTQHQLHKTHSDNRGHKLSFQTEYKAQSRYLPDRNDLLID